MLKRHCAGGGCRGARWARDLRDQTDCDSADFLHVVFGIHKELGIEIPDAEVAKFTTWNCGVRYLLSKAGKT